MSEEYTFQDLLSLIETLRSETGCPWDRTQTFDTMKECLVNECQEVIQAVDNKDMDNLCEELGDVLLQVVMNSQIAKEEGLFTIVDVIDGLCRKLIRRHPHVFADAAALTPEEGLMQWEEIKRLEKQEKQQKKEKETKSY